MRLYVQLGKLGDILNLLPLLKMEADTSSGDIPGLMVAREFADVLEGVRYVKHFVYDGPYYEVAQACDQAAKISPNWVCTQVNCSTENVVKYVYGPAKQRCAVTTSFQKESWRVAGKLALWDNQQQLIFDNRDQMRELKLALPWKPGKPKLILMALGGSTSPFPYADLLRELILAKFQDRKKWNVIDLCQVKGKHFYDLLGLYDQAHCLIATDSAPLHLARACPTLPVFAFVNDKPLLWNGSPWRPNHDFYCRYSDFPARASAFVWSLDHIGAMGYRAKSEPGIVHVWSEYDGSVVCQRPDWFEEYSTGYWTRLPIEPGSCGRDSANTIKDEKRFPYLRDCLRMAMQRARKDDLICLTRPDTRFMANLTATLAKHPLSFAYRFSRKDDRDTFAPIGELFCAPRSWWKERLADIPDLIWGTDYFWSHVLACLFAKHGAYDATGIVYHFAK